jgi:2-polyprenyl-6-methoxyphenol hydroxylase-like FAD-dependent oxidoreductase
MAVRFVVIIADNIDNTQRNQIHQLVKSQSEEWWHEFANTWIVRSEHHSSGWRDALQPIFHERPSALVVLDLPTKGGRGWATRFVDSDWLRDEYTQWSPPDEQPK